MLCYFNSDNLLCNGYLLLGPAGFYASQHLINHGGDKITVDIFERLPIPFGLVSWLLILLIMIINIPNHKL